MSIELFLCLLLAHLVADFGLQTSASCKSKAEKHWRSVHLYIHAGIVFVLTWLASFEFRFWWCALIIGMSHLLIDVWKSYRKEDIVWFLLDQFLHLVVLAGFAYLWSSVYGWRNPFGVESWWIAAVIAVLICWKPSNIFIKLTLKHYSVDMPREKEGGFNAGALIGTIERLLILIFVYLHRYDALGLLIAAKSIIRFGDSQTNKSEYVLAGTLLSIFIAVLAGLGVMMVHKYCL
jgi:hypothetical protein